MPVIPTFEADAQIPEPGGSPQINPNTQGRPGAAIAEGFGQLSDQQAAFEARYQDARRMADAADRIAKASQQLGDAQFKWSKIPDREQATAGFNKDADAIEKQTTDGISDPFVLEHVKERLGSERVIRELDTQNAAFDLESSKRRGDLDANLLQFSQSAAAATTPELRAKIVDDANANIEGAAAAGWIRPEDAAQLKIKFGSQVQEVDVRSRMNAALDSQDPNAMSALAKDLNDASKFPGLLPEEREVLSTRIENMQYRLDVRAAARIAHADAMNDKALHQQQSHNETVLLMNTYEGKGPSDADLENYALHGLISPSGLEAVHSAKDRASAGYNDPDVSLHLWHAIDTGDAKPDDIYAAQKAGKLSTATSIEMMKTIDAKSGKGDTANAKADFGILKSGLQGNAIDNGLAVMGSDRRTAAQRWTEAQAEWHQRVTVSGEDPDAVLSEMLPKYGSSARPTWLAQPKFGAIDSAKDLATVAVKTVKAHQAKQLSDADYADQVELLNNYKRYFSGIAAHENATKAARAKPKAAAAAPASSSATEANP